MRSDMIALADLYDDPIDPATIQYRAVPARVKAPRGQSDKACAGCYFKGQKAKVCVQACQLARLALMPDCEDVDPETGRNFIYVLRPIDPRQIDLVNGETK